MGVQFQVLFHSPSGVLFTFPSRYLCAIGQRLVFSLGGWSPQIPTGFHVSRGTQETVPGSPKNFAYRAFTFYGVGFQPLRLFLGFITSRRRCAFFRTVPTTPCVQRAHAFTYTRFRLFPVRSPLLRESRLISFPPGTKMFQFPGLRSLASFTYQRCSDLSSEQVSPFGDPGITGCLLLPRAYRSLPRPSSATSAKASVVHP